MLQFLSIMLDIEIFVIKAVLAVFTGFCLGILLFWVVLKGIYPPWGYVYSICCVVAMCRIGLALDEEE